MGAHVVQAWAMFTLSDALMCFLSVVRPQRLYDVLMLLCSMQCLYGASSSGLPVDPACQRSRAVFRARSGVELATIHSSSVTAQTCTARWHEGRACNLRTHRTSSVNCPPPSARHLACASNAVRTWPHGCWLSRAATTELSEARR